MSRRLATVLLAGGLLGLVWGGVPVPAGAEPSSTGLAYMSERVCATPALGYAACDAVQLVPVATDKGPGGGHNPHSSPPPVSYYAPELQQAYALVAAAGSDGAGKSVAVVDAYDDPNAYSDLVAYRADANNGLGGIAECQATDGRPDLSGSGPCFAKVNQDGLESSYPQANTSWAEEISLDLDAVSALCPECNIVLVEADSNNLADLGTAVDTAASFGPAAIGNSYGGSEFSTEGSYAAEYYDHPGVAVTAASGDNGYGAEFPAAASSVIAVGGTSLSVDSSTSRGWEETVWSGTGSGCSAVIPKPDWQTDTGCSGYRTVGDVAADADPYTGLNVYDTYGEPGWLVFGGTSASAQIIAGVYGLAGGLPSSYPDGAEGLYYAGSQINFGATNPDLNDVTSGSNGSCTGHGHFADPSLAYLCTAGTGYDGPTGMGTPSGTGAF